jgi:hypothetical protein
MVVKIQNHPRQKIDFIASGLDNHLYLYIKTIEFRIKIGLFLFMNQLPSFLLSANKPIRPYSFI